MTTQRSVNHEKGDIYMKDCTVTAERYRPLMMKVFAAVKAKMPWLKGKRVIIQQDGATPHTAKGNAEYGNSILRDI